MQFIKTLLQEYNDTTSFAEHISSGETKQLLLAIKAYLENRGSLKSIASAAYDVITSSAVGQTEIENKFGKHADLVELSKTSKYKEIAPKYTNNISNIIKYITQSKKWDKQDTLNSGAWAHFVKVGNKPSSEKTHKWYATLKGNRNPDDIKIIANILYDMDSVDFDNQIQLKVPGNYLSFIKHLDTIVIHFRSEEDKQKLKPIIQKYQKYFADRNKLGRQDYGVDDKSFDKDQDNSDSMIVAKKFAKTVEQNKETIKQYYTTLKPLEIAKKLLAILEQISKHSSHRN